MQVLVQVILYYYVNTLTGNVFHQNGRRAPAGYVVVIAVIVVVVQVRRSAFGGGGDSGRVYRRLADRRQRRGTGRARGRRAVRFGRRRLQRDGRPLVGGDDSLGQRLVHGRLVRRGGRSGRRLGGVMMVPRQAEQERGRGRRVEHDARPELFGREERQRTSQRGRHGHTVVSEHYGNTIINNNYTMCVKINEFSGGNRDEEAFLRKTSSGGTPVYYI